MIERSRWNHAGSPARALILVATMLLAMAVSATAASLHQQWLDGEKAPDPVKSLAGTVEVVVGSGGTVWSNRSGVWSDLEYPGSEDLEDIDAADPGEFWVCGAQGVRQYVGESWGALQDVGGAMHGIIAHDDGVVTCGVSGRVMRRSGGSWTNLASGTGATLYGIWGTSAGDFWVCGGGGLIQRYRDGAWEVIASGTSASLRAVWGAPGVGPYFVGNDGTILRWRGGQIEPMTSGTTADLLAVHGTSDANLWAVGSGPSALRWDGTSWQDMAAPGGFNLPGLNVLPSGVAIASDTNGNLRTYRAGEWTRRDTGANVVLVEVISLPSQDNRRWWDGFRRPALGGQGLASGDFAGGGSDLAIHDGRLVCLGNFQTAGQTPAVGVAAWDGETWTAFADATPAYFEGYGLTVHAGLVTAFVTVADSAAVHQWDGTQWQVLAALPDGMTTFRQLRTLTIDGVETLLVAGAATHPDAPGETGVFAWDPVGEAWTPLGQGLDPDLQLYGATMSGGDLWVSGGEFGTPPRGVVYRLPGGDADATWQNELDTNAYFAVDLAVHDGDLYVSTALGENVDAVLRWNEATDGWDGLSAIIASGYVFDLVSWDDALMLLGGFESINDVGSRNIAMLRDGTIEPLGIGTSGAAIIALPYAGDLYVVGSFSAAGARESWSIARWSGALQEPGPPTVQLIVDETATEGSLLAVTANVSSYQTVESARLSYRALDRDDYTHVPMVRAGKGDGNWEAVVPGADVAEYGVQYFVTVQTDEYVVNVPPDPAQQVAFAGIAVADEWTAPEAMRYELIGVPFTAAGSFADVFEDDLGGYDPGRWRIERWGPAAGDYVSYPSVAALAPGRGYWIIQRDPVTIDVAGATTSTAGGTDIALEPGWNMIAAPYLFSIPWATVDRPLGVEDVIYGRVDDGYVEAATLEPWRGYFIFHGGMAPVTLNIPANPGAKAAGAKAAGTKAAGSGAGSLSGADHPAGCQWSLIISATQGGRRDLTKVVGALASGEDGPGDLHQPPALEHDLAVWLSSTDDDGTPRRLRRDLRAFDGGAVWDLVIRPAAGEASPPRLAFDNVDDVPSALRVALVTPSGTVDLRAAGGTWEAPSRAETRVRLVVGDPELVQEAAATLPQPYALLPNYPNPFNPTTHLAFTTPREGRVRLELYDVAGRRVRTLVDEVRPAGRHDVVWNGTDDRGRGLASGIYFARLQADDFGQTRKLTLVR